MIKYEPIPNVVNVDDIQEIMETNKRVEQENIKLNNIIKEVREEVKEARLWNWTEQKILIDKFTKRLLEILDKGE